MRSGSAGGKANSRTARFPPPRNPEMDQSTRRQSLDAVALALIAFAILTLAIATRVPKWLTDFDQSFYITIAYDLDRHGVFSNGVFDDTDSTAAAPPPGIFF